MCEDMRLIQGSNGLRQTPCEVVDDRKLSEIIEKTSDAFRKMLGAFR